MNSKFSIVVCDPPWSFSDRLQHSDVKRGAEANYSTMSNESLLSLPIKNVIDPNGSVMALWVPSSLLQLGLDVMKAWGFEYKQSWIWVKIKKDPFKKFNKSSKVNWDDFLSFGMGRLGRNVHEIALIGTVGKVYKNLKNKSQRTVLFDVNTKHSKKPELLQDKLELMYPDGNYLEIFGRRLRKNWTVIGNESPSTLNEDVMISLQKLIK